MSFKHVAFRPLPYSMGVLIGSDWQDKPADDPVFGLYRTCGFWTHREARLLCEVAKQFGGQWLEIGAHTGWCSSHIAPHVERVISIEPMFSLGEWFTRFAENVSKCMAEGRIMPWAGRSDQYFECWDGGGGRTFDGVLIDGDHNGPCPLNDAKHAFDRLNERGVILLHDFRGPDVWDAAKYLTDRGMNFALYPSVHMIGVCWRGEFEPPPTFQEGSVDWAKHYGLPEWLD